MEKPKLLIVAGPNGSGKTSVTDKILKHEWIDGCEYINPDDMARDIYGDWNSPEAVVKAVCHAARIREDCIANGRSLAFETVMSAPDKISFVQQAKQNGYFIRLFFIPLPIEFFPSARPFTLWADNLLPTANGLPQSIVADFSTGFGISQQTIHKLMPLVLSIAWFQAVTMFRYRKSSAVIPNPLSIVAYFFLLLTDCTFMTTPSKMLSHNCYSAQLTAN